MNNQFDVVAIGDTVVDAFIKLDVGHVQEHDGNTEYCLPFGSKIPFTDVTVLAGVGNSANASVSASRLGLKASLITFLGNDANGLECISSLRKNGVNTDFITQEDGKKTNYHYVLWHGDERTILIKHEAFKVALPDFGIPKWIYLSSLGSHTEPFHHELENYLEKNPEVKLAYQPGTFQLSLGIEKLKKIYEHTEVFCANKEEVEGLLSMKGADMKTLMNKLGELGPKIILISDGPHGAYMKHGESYYFMPIYPDIAPPVERTGAGDAFMSTFVSFLIKGKTPEEALMRAPINSMNVNQHIGAQEGLLSEKEVEDYLAKAPASYALQTL
jgi:ribokinase